MRFFFVPASLLCLIAVVTAAEPRNDCLKYKLTSKKYIQTEMGAKNLLRINFEVWLSPYKGSSNMFSMNMRIPEAFFERQITKETLDLNMCPSVITSASRFQLPTLVVFDDDGLLQEIRADKRLAEISANVLFYVAGLLQVNRKALTGSSGQTSRTKDELMFIGNCPVSYDVRKDDGKKGDTLRVIKKYDLNKCDDLDRDKKTSNGTKLLASNGVSELIIKREKGRMVTELLIFTANFNQTSKQNPENGVNLDVEITVALDKATSCEGVPNFVNPNAQVMKRLLLRPVDKKLLEKSGDKGVSDFEEIYKALASDGTVTNIYQEFYERALKCWQIVG